MYSHGRDSLRRTHWFYRFFFLGCLLAQPSLAQAVGAQPVLAEIRTDPPGADVFLNWVFQGETPLRIADLQNGDRLLVFKDGYQGRYRTIEEPRSFYFKLAPSVELERQRLLLRVHGPNAPEFRALLVYRLIQEGFFILTDDDALQLEGELQVAFEKSRSAFRAWASAKFRSHLWIVVRLPGSDPIEDPSRLLDPDDLTELLNAATLESPYVSLRIIDLRSGSLFYHEVMEIKTFNTRRQAFRTRELEQLLEWIATTLRDQIIGPSATEIPLEEPPAAEGG